MIQLGQTSCYKCEACPEGTVLRNNKCEKPFVPKCRCHEQYDIKTNTCVECAENSASGNDETKQDGVCTPQDCKNKGHIQLGKEYCYKCHPCRPNEILDVPTNKCKLKVVKCSCTQQYDPLSNMCYECPPGSASGNNDNKQDGVCAPMNCNAKGLRQMGKD